MTPRVTPPMPPLACDCYPSQVRLRGTASPVRTLSSLVSVAMQPVDLCLAGVSPLEDQPSEVSLATAGLFAPCNDVSRRDGWSRRKQPDPPKRQLLQPPSGIQTRYWKQQRDLAGAELKRMTGKSFDRVEWRISNDGRRRRLTVEEILNQASGVALINDVGGNDSVAGDLGCLGDAAKAGAGVQQNLAAIKVLRPGTTELRPRSAPRNDRTFHGPRCATAAAVC